MSQEASVNASAHATPHATAHASEAPESTTNENEIRLAKRALDGLIQSAHQRFGDTIAELDAISTFRPIQTWKAARSVRAQFKEIDAMYIAALNAIIERAEYGTTINRSGTQSIVPKVTTKATAHITVLSGEWRGVHDAVNRLEATAIAVVAFYISIVSFIVSLATPFLMLG